MLDLHFGDQWQLAICYAPIPPESFIFTFDFNCTVRVISPVQSEHTCSEMRYFNHRDQCLWRCGTARQHNLLGLS